MESWNQKDTNARQVILSWDWEPLLYSRQIILIPSVYRRSSDFNTGKKTSILAALENAQQSVL